MNMNPGSDETKFMYRLQATPKLDIENKTLAFDYQETINGQVVNAYKEVLNLKEQAIKKALVALGWTPPHENVCSSIARGRKRLPIDFWRFWRKE